MDDVFEVTMRAWGPCNPYDEFDPFYFLNAVTTTSRLRLIESPPAPSPNDVDACLSDAEPLPPLTVTGDPAATSFNWYSDF